MEVCKLEHWNFLPDSSSDQLHHPQSLAAWRLTISSWHCSLGSPAGDFPGSEKKWGFVLLSLTVSVFQSMHWIMWFETNQFMVLTHRVQTPSLKNVLKETVKIPGLSECSDEPGHSTHFRQSYCPCVYAQLPKLLIILKQSWAKKNERIPFVMHFTSMLNPVCQQ